jgi:hypothetical protein
MSLAKIAAALRAAADVLDAEDAATESASPAKSRVKAPKSSPPAATPAAAPAQAPAAAPPAQSPEVATVKIVAVNAAVLALAGKDRDRAMAVLAEFKVTRTPELKPEMYQSVIDRMEEEVAKLDAASTQVSLV